MKTVRFLITLSFIFLSIWATKAQWAGEDKYILKGQSAHIGKVEPGVNASYEWSGPNITTDKYSPTVTVKPSADSTTYIVQKIDSCGVYKDTVIVYTSDSVSILRVTPKSCYTDGDTLTPEDFIIVTIPSGYASQVKISPKVVSLSNGLFDAIGHGQNPIQGLQQSGTVDVTFTLTHQNHTSTKTVGIQVYKDEPVSTPTISVSLKEFLKMIEKAKRVASTVEKAAISLKKIAPASPIKPPCEPSFDLNVEIPIPMPFLACCEGNKVEGVNLSGPVTTLSAGVDCDFDTPWSIPGTGTGLFVTAGFSGGVTLKPYEFKFRGWECSRLEFPFEIFFEGYGGAKAKALDDDILSLAIKFVAHGSAQFNTVISKTGIKWGLEKGLPIEFSLVAEATAHSLFTFKIPVPLGTIVLFQDNNKQ